MADLRHTGLLWRARQVLDARYQPATCPSRAATTGWLRRASAREVSDREVGVVVAVLVSSAWSRRPPSTVEHHLANARSNVGPP